MENTTYIALSRQTSLHRQLGMVANNIANMNTTAYKGEEPLFVEYLVKSQASERKFDNKVSFVQDLGTVRDFSCGQMIQTDNPLDVAIQGDGYFAIEAPEGERFTRNGSFKLDNQGQMVTSSGYPVMSEDLQPFFFAPTETQITIARDGTVSTENGTIGKLRVVEFEKQQELKKTHSGLYETSSSNSPANVESPDLTQGMLEQSNVKPVVEMTKMIAIQRSFSKLNKIMEEEDGRIRKAVEALSRQGRA
ncbi:MAG: flagellar basal-body rod protein FlgF [Alphaproteobacteria bacterium]|nr:flagellar basal-body rod protein FlgF [Alphaproteobacteria bacterium]